MDPDLGQEIARHDTALVSLDPLVAFMGDTVNTHRDHHVRRVLAPLAHMAEHTGASVVGVVHTNKAVGTEPLMRLSGSVGFTGAARAILMAAEDPEDDSRRIFCVVKNNLAAYPPPLAYRVATAEVDGGIVTSRIEWLGEAPDVDPRELLAARDPEEVSQRKDAEEYLRGLGLDRQAMPVTEIVKEAEGMGVGHKTLQRVRRSLRIPHWREGFPAVTYWGPRREGQSGQGTPDPVQPVHSVQTGADQRKQTLEHTEWTGGFVVRGSLPSPGLDDGKEPPTAVSAQGVPNPESGTLNLEELVALFPSVAEAHNFARKRLNWPDLPSLLALSAEQRALVADGRGRH
jgi:hypothetical protein